MIVIAPRILTKELAAQAVEIALKACMFSEEMRSIVRHPMCHIVVMVMAEHERDYQTFFEPYVLYQRSVGNTDDWPRPYNEIAYKKARQLWRGQNSDGNTDIQPHLLVPGDTIFWGGVKRHGIVVACSGVQPYFDQLISGVTADFIKALARHAYENSREKNEQISFLG